MIISQNVNSAWKSKERLLPACRSGPELEAMEFDNPKRGEARFPMGRPGLEVLSRFRVDTDNRSLYGRSALLGTLSRPKENSRLTRRLTVK